MKENLRKYDVCSYVNATARNKRYSAEHVDSSRRFVEDANKKLRKEIMECGACFYLFSERVGGAAFTTSCCGICEREMIFPSTCTDSLCLECAQTNNLCKRCGADFNLKLGRNKIFKQKAVGERKL